MKRLFLLSIDIIVLGLVSKILSPFLFLNPYDLVLCFILVKVADIQQQLKQK